MTTEVNSANYGLRVSYRLRSTSLVVDTEFTGPNKAADSEALNTEMRDRCDFIVTQAFIPEAADA